MVYDGFTNSCYVCKCAEKKLHGNLLIRFKIQYLHIFLCLCVKKWNARNSKPEQRSFTTRYTQIYILHALFKHRRKISSDKNIKCYFASQMAQVNVHVYINDEEKRTECVV